MRNAVLRAGRSCPGQRAVKLSVDDFEVVETERRTTAAVALLVDLSYSMALRGTWGAAKSTALALHSLVTTRYPQDAIEIIGFSDYARRLRPEELAGLSWDMVQGTNLQHGLMLAQRHLDKHRDAEPVVLVVTDGEPTAHLLPNGRAEFAWPPLQETLELTMAEVEKLTRFGATINVFMLDDEPRLVRFVESLAQRNGGRVFAPSVEALGDYVVSDYIKARRARPPLMPRVLRDASVADARDQLPTGCARSAIGPPPSLLCSRRRPAALDRAGPASELGGHSLHQGDPARGSATRSSERPRRMLL